MFGFFTIGKCKGRFKGGGILRRNMGNALAGFFLFMFGSAFFGVYFLSIAVVLVVSLLNIIQNAFIIISINIGLRRR